jgi:hypothetical protein
MPEIANDDLPLFVRVTAFGELMVPRAWVPKFRLVGAIVMYVPIPVRLSTCDPEPSSSVIVTVPYLTPGIVGVKVTVMVQVPPADKLEPQLLVSL